MPSDTPATAAAPKTDTLHVMVPWAASLAEPCQKQLSQLDDAKAFPRLHRLLGLLTQQQWLRGDEYSPHAPHERVWAQTMGWPHGETDALPWAAWLARQDGLDTRQGAWGLMTPCHWLMGHDHLTMLHPDELALGEDEARAVFAAIAPLFSEDGWQIHWGAPTRWYVCHDTLADLPTASLDRVLGRNPDLWMPDHPQARLIKRLQSEVQMLLYQLPLNDQRQERGAYPVNSFWLSGCGRWPASGTECAGLQVEEGPRLASLKQDTAAWLAAWQALEAQACGAWLSALDQGVPMRLTLCGERHAVTLSAPPKPHWWQGAWQATVGRMSQRPASPSQLLASL
jgi:hypothetical protein